MNNEDRIEELENNVELLTQTVEMLVETLGKQKEINQHLIETASLQLKWIKEHRC